MTVADCSLRRLIACIVYGSGTVGYVDCSAYYSIKPMTSHALGGLASIDAYFRDIGLVTLGLETHFPNVSVSTLGPQRLVYIPGIVRTGLKNNPAEF